MITVMPLRQVSSSPSLRVIQMIGRLRPIRATLRGNTVSIARGRTSAKSVPVLAEESDGVWVPNSSGLADRTIATSVVACQETESVGSLSFDRTIRSRPSPVPTPSLRLYDAGPR